MHVSTKPPLLALALFSWVPSTHAFVPLVDRAHGIIQQRPYCPPRPASPEFQRAALYEYLSEYFFETGGIVSAFDNFIDANYIQHSPNELPYGRKASLAEILKAEDSFSGVIVPILEVLFDIPYEMGHWRLGVPGAEPFAFVDMWRFNGTYVVEHWDVVEQLTANDTNPIALF